MTDNDDLGWSDPMVVLGAVVLAAAIIWLVISIATGHNPFHEGDRSSSPSVSRSVAPSGSSVLTSAPSVGGFPYRNCAAAARDGRWNIHIGDPAYNPALDRDRDGIACKR